MQTFKYFIQEAGGGELRQVNLRSPKQMSKMLESMQSWKCKRMAEN